MINDIRHFRRLIGIGITLAREDALFIFDDVDLGWIALLLSPFKVRKPGKRKGERLAAALPKLGPAFIKLGQALSVRSDLIGEEMAEDLSGLRDSLPPFSSSTACTIVESEFQTKLDTIFSDFGGAVAAASIAQVHKAKLKDGRDVAVKILRPDIERAFNHDIELFFWIATFVERRETYRRLKPVEVVNTLKESVFFELDLRFEASAAHEFAENLKKHPPGMRAPVVDWSLTSRRVMVMEWIDGIPLNDIEAIRQSGHDIDAILTKASQSLFAQVFKDGFFHADLHPGNLFVDKNGDLVAVDFGIMGRLDWKSRMYIAEILRGFLTGDYRHVAEVHFTAGYVPPYKSLDAFTQACMAVARPITGKPMNEISVAKLLGQMFKIAAEFDMETQPQLLLMQKTMMVSEGVGRMLNPNLNMWELARPMIEDWATEHFGARGKFKEASRHGVDAVQKLPMMLGYLENALKSLGDPQGITIHPKHIEAIKFARDARHRQWMIFAWSSVIITVLALLLR